MMHLALTIILYFLSIPFLLYFGFKIIGILLDGYIRYGKRVLNYLERRLGWYDS